MSKATEKTKGEVEVAALHCETNREAGRALGIGDEAFVELCRQYEIETPHDREKRLTEQQLREGRENRMAREGGPPS